MALAVISGHLRRSDNDLLEGFLQESSFFSCKRIANACSSFGIYRRIALPLMKPALATLGVFSFMASWNNFFGPFIFLDRKYLFTVQLGVALVQRQWYTSWPRLMAGSVVVTLPVLLVFLLLQRYFVRGISLTGIKG